MQSPTPARAAHTCTRDASERDADPLSFTRGLKVGNSQFQGKIEKSKNLRSAIFYYNIQFSYIAISAAPSTSNI
jgi:hypothetical protein